MTKAALENMVKWMCITLREDNIRINTITPGIIKTEFSGPLWKNRDDVNEKAKGEASEIASVAAMMCSKEGSFINGTSFYVHGGFPHLE